MENPKIRFKGFTKAWEQRKFGELYSKVSEKNDLSFGADKIISVANMYFKEEVKDSSDEYMRTYNVMRLGDIAFEGNKSKNYSHGRFVENTIGDGIVSHVFDVFRPTTSYDLLFWKYLINNEGIMGRIMARCTNASTMMTNLVASDFLKEKILAPSLKEQKKIGAYFDNLDHLITLHQRKCEQTKNLKKYMLQKMFPQNGAKVPEIRFDGFTYDWEQRKLSDVVNIGSGMDYKHLGEGNIPVYGTGGYMCSVDKALSNDKDAIGIGRKGTIDKPYILRAPFWTVDTLFYCIPKEGYDLDFTSCLFQNVDWKKKDESTGVPSLSKLIISNVETYTPTYDEQKKIGEYFQSLDHLITLHQRKCDELKKMKKYMLQNMFI